jgi:cytochrome c biogenesis protein CcmG/thiol:disulfide interchange protein DsbE
MNRKTPITGSTEMREAYRPVPFVGRMPDPSPDFQRRTLMRSMVGLGLGIAGSGLFARQANANELKLGQPAPPLTLHTIDGKTIATRDLLGQVVIATFWATWCAPCIEELPLLSAYAARHAQEGLQVLGFSLDDPENLPEVRKMAGKLSFPVGLLGSAWAGGYGRIWHCPVSFVIDRAGRLTDNGWDDSQPVWTKERLQRVVAPLLVRKG